MTNARIGVPLMINSCFLVLFALLRTNFVPEVKLSFTPLDMHIISTLSYRKSSPSMQPEFAVISDSLMYLN